MRILLDTNVVGRLSQPQHHLHQIAVEATERLLSAGHDLRLVPQVLYEFWVVATRTLDENGFGFSIAEAHAELNRIKVIFPLLLDERGILAPWETLVVKHAVRGKNAHDARLVAAMQRHGITDLLTFNGEDFKRYPAISVLDPNVVAVT
jgi:predicted nucleic acid-binding protein